MIFNSINYFLFLSLVFILYYLMPNKLKWTILLAASIAFYLIGGGIKTIVVPLIIIVSTFICGIFIEKANTTRRKQYFFLMGLMVNIGLLMFFKYVNFFIETITNAIGFFKNLSPEGGVEIFYTPFVLNILVPLGISYVTFQAIAYLIEVKREALKAEKSLGLFATYLLFFPKLLSGPIEPAQNFLPQLHQPKNFEYERVLYGLKRILRGLFLKLVVANRLEIYTEAVFGNYNHHSGSTLLVAAFFYTIQMFADFAGYTDMAIGSAEIFGYKLIENFNNPFIAKSVTEFWRRWHISLSSWVNEYIYNPVAINRRSWNKWAVVFACMVTFLILGFWHGPNWNYILFGFLQGVILSVELFTRKIRKRFRSKVPLWINSLLGTSFTFSYFCFSLIIFRNTDISDAFSILKRIFTIHGQIYYDNPSMMIFCCLATLMLLSVEMKKIYYSGNFSFFYNEKWIVRSLSYIAVVLIILLIGVFDGGQFIYFKF